MKSTKFLAAAVLVLVSFASCGKPKNTEMAAQAMERARAAEAPKYAPAEFSKADALYKKMNEALNVKNNKEASSYADQTVSAANEATARARENKAVILIGELAQLLTESQRQGIHESHGQAYNQAAQAHIDASAFRDVKDYEKAIQAAQMGIDILKPLVSQKAAEARDLLEKARTRYQAVSSSVDNKRYETELTNAKKELDSAEAAYKNKDYDTTKTHAQNVLDILNDLAALAATATARPLANDSLQLQSYQLLSQLSNTIAYIKKNNYTNDVYLSNQKAAPSNQPLPSYTVPAQVTEEPSPAEDEIFIFMEDEEAEPMEDALSYMPLSYRAQNMGDPEVITLTMIEEKYSQAKAAYDEANYINAIDTTREGLRLADLFLAGQSIGVHRVIRGNTLWGIAGSYYNKRFLLWPHIWTANKFQIKDPDLIYPGQMFRIPPAPQPVK